jgi:hypothetical protein
MFTFSSILLSIPVYVRSSCLINFFLGDFYCFHFNSIYESSLIACIPYASFFLLISMTRNIVTISVFCLLGDYFCALYAVANHCSISMTENIILFPYTYVKDTKFNPGFQRFSSPLPHSPVGDTCLFISFVYIFGKGEKGRGRST